ncbi:hypothetical protein [Deinococcus budaensis]|uniref:Uncharacterized protein n=1 Tax=Deinococcus budaensis TaxID=1665626 RepID=A0A7W8GDL7_9DEIO|nr:hypothetical protein [Deinococcus budaensis]MBB5233657.1 hypothetical protein [Deinococcus budaensis]
MRGLSLLLALGALLGALGAGFLAGRATLPPGPGDAAARVSQAAAQPLTATLPGDPRELIPLVPGPGEGPGQTPPGLPQPGPQPPPGQAPGEGECTVLLHRDGQFYRLQPGQPGTGQPGQGQPQPGPGQRGDGQPGADSDELFPLEPFGPGPGLPDLPGLPPTQPDQPGLDLRV